VRYDRPITSRVIAAGQEPSHREAQGGATMLLRSTLVINAISTALCGLALLLAPAPLAELLGVSPPAILAGVGAGLVLYAAGLVWTARRQPIPGAAAWAAIVLDLGWVLGSVAVVELGILSSIGAGLVALVAALVLVFAVLQLVGVRHAARPA
jgi:hypothetical protein